jgi:hypothetical protein
MFRERKDIERGKDGALNKVRRAYKTRTKKRGPLQINSFYDRRGKSKKDTYFYCTFYGYLTNNNTGTNRSIYSIK